MQRQIYHFQKKNEKKKAQKIIKLPDKKLIQGTLIMIRKEIDSIIKNLIV